MKPWRALGALALAACGLSLPTAAGAAPLPADRIAAEALFDDALRLMEAGDFEAACPRLAESERLDAAIGTLLYLGHCYRQQGRTASAWSAFRAAAAASREAEQSEREQVAEQSAAELKPLLTRLILVMDEPPSGVVVRRDGYAMSGQLIGVAVPVDPGEHLVTVSAPGKRSWSKRVEVPADPGTYTFTIPPLAAAPPPKPPARPRPATRPNREVIGWLLAGAGAAAMTSGAIVAASDGSDVTAIALTAIGSASIGAGGLLLLLPGPSADGPPTVALSFGTRF